MEYPQLALKEIAQRLNIECESDKIITGLNTLRDANMNEISFLENSKYQSDLQSSQAGAVFVTPKLVHLVPKNTVALVTAAPYIALAKASAFFAPPLLEENGSEAVVDATSTISPGVFLGKNTTVGKNCILMSGCFVGDNVVIGDNVVLHPHTSIYRDCVIGSDVIIHAGSVIGSDGFGFAHTDDGKYIKIYQNGNVVIHDDVEIGANTCIDRAAFASTIIHKGVRIDNLVHIAHNCIIGEGSILTGQVGLSGSTTLKEYVVMGGQSATAGHLEIAPFTTIAARGGVTKSITQPKKQWAGFPLMEHRIWLKLQSKIARLLK